MMTIKNTLETTRPSPGPGFESRAVAAAMLRARKQRRRRVVVAGGVAAALAAAGIVAALIASDRTSLAIAAPEPPPLEDPVQPEPVQTPVPAAGGVSEDAAEIAAGGPPPAERYADLEIPESQQTRVDRIVLDLKKREIKLVAEIEIAELELAQALSATRVDRALVAKRLREKARLVGELDLVRTLAWVEIRAIVGPRTLARKAPARANRPRSKSWANLLPPKKGVLKINTTPYSTVFIDGRKVGITPLQIEVAAGRHRITFKYSNDVVQRRTVLVKAGETKTVTRAAPSLLLE